MALKKREKKNIRSREKEKERKKSLVILQLKKN